MMFEVDVGEAAIFVGITVLTCRSVSVASMLLIIKIEAAMPMKIARRGRVDRSCVVEDDNMC